MEASTDRFTIADYESILEAAHAHGYRFTKFTDPTPAPGSQVVYLRHDIDNSIECALLMAELEAREGALSTYLVMVRSDNYNPFTGDNVSRLRQIRELGHDVGLHFAADEHEPAARETDLAACIAADAELLERALGTPVHVFSFHNPGESGDFTIEVPGLVNAYGNRFCADARYLSESNMRWPRGSPVDVLSSRQHPVVQILVHPLSYRDDFRSDRDVLLWFIRDVTERLLAVNVSQNRVLREQGLSLADVAGYLLDGEEPS
jgi:hypothetical protein